jgi:hypothetical protein
MIRCLAFGVIGTLPARCLSIKADRAIQGAGRLFSMAIGSAPLLVSATPPTPAYRRQG